MVMAAAALQNTCGAPKTSSIGLPNEIVSRILLLASTPTFFQLVQTSKQFHNAAKGDRKVLLHHLHQVPGEKESFTNASLSNAELFLLLRQRATNNLYGTNFTANMTEYKAKAPLDANASVIGGLTAEYVRMALIYKDSGDIRYYTKDCIIKEVLVQQPGMKVLKTDQCGNTLSVLCAWPQKADEDFPDSDSESEDEVCIESPFPPTANTQLTNFVHAQKEKTAGGSHEKDRTTKMNYEKPKAAAKAGRVYRVVHFDLYKMEDSRTFTIDAYEDFVPRDFVTSSLDQCAILWDRDLPGGRPTEDATVLYYSAKEAQFHYAANYDARVVWPKTDATGKPVKENDPEYLPERIEFFKEGRRIKIYGAGGAVPYRITSTSSSQQDPMYASTNVISYDGFSIHVETPFFGTHATHYDDLHQQNWCFLTHMCLGVTTVDLGDDDDDDDDDEDKKVKVLCLLRSQIRAYPESCKHDVGYSRMYHVSGQNATVVARLWGWEEMHTTLTGKETVAISDEGTRIAIAMWDKVYVYPINPRILCAENPVDNSDDESAKPKKRKKSRGLWDTAPSSYYTRKKDKNLSHWKIAELRPIVLDLNGAVAQKLSWSKPRDTPTDLASAKMEVVEPVVDDVDIGTEDTVTLASDPLSETTTESTVVTAIQDHDNAEDEAPPVTPSGFEPEGGFGQPATTVVQHSPEAEPTPNPTPIHQEANEEKVIESSSEQSLEPQKSTTDMTEAAAMLSNMESHSSTPASPSSPSITSLKEDGSPAPLTNGVVAPTPTASLSLLNTPSSLSPFNSMTGSHTAPAQPIKPSPRKKEKFAELNSFENAPPSPMKEKSLLEYTEPCQEHKASAEASIPSSPGLSKKMSKSKHDVSEVSTTLAALALQDEEPKQQSTEPALAQPAATDEPEAQVEPRPTEPESKTEMLEITSETSAQPTATKQDDLVTAATDINPPTSSSSSAPAIELGTYAQLHTQKPRAKRITEDELMILTDRGIQIWNIGARAKGERVKKMLPLNESLKGKLPLRKGKQKATSTDGVDMDMDVDKRLN